MELTPKTVVVRQAAPGDMLEGDEARKDRRCWMCDDVIQEGSPDSDMCEGCYDEEQANKAKEKEKAAAEAAIPNTQKVRKQSEGIDPYFAIPLEKAKAKLTAQGFKDLNQVGQYTGSTVSVWQNPHTGQRANLKHIYEKKGKKVDLASISYHLLAKDRPKRRPPEQKYRDNYIHYD
jgi:hypothetical protein